MEGKSFQQCSTEYAYCHVSTVITYRWETINEPPSTSTLPSAPLGASPLDKTLYRPLCTCWSNEAAIRIKLQYHDTKPTCSHLTRTLPVESLMWARSVSTKGVVESLMTLCRPLLLQIVVLVVETVHLHIGCAQGDRTVLQSVYSYTSTGSNDGLY
ncbi:hypothetical protein J6590_039517 [Homalodisca vitripennis]|nr:hypothetical protein J6590_039517 [Homalodisca vitripennis]